MAIVLQYEPTLKSSGQDQVKIKPLSSQDQVKIPQSAIVYEGLRSPCAKAVAIYSVFEA